MKELKDWTLGQIKNACVKQITKEGCINTCILSEICNYNTETLAGIDDLLDKFENQQF